MLQCGKRNPQDELVAANTTSGEDTFCVWRIRDGQEFSPQRIEPSRLGKLEIATIPSDTCHSIHDQKNPYANHSDGASSIDAAKRPIERPQKSSYIMEEAVPLNYDTFLQDNEHQQRAGRREFLALFSSEYSCGQPRTSHD